MMMNQRTTMEGTIFRIAGRRRTRSWSLPAVAVVAATSLVLTASLASCFQPEAAFLPRQPHQTRPAASVSGPPRYAALADADVLLMERVRQRAADDPSMDDVYVYTDQQTMGALNESSSRTTNKAPVQFRGLSTTAKKRKGKQSMKQPRSSRSSTMPGFKTETDRQKAYRDGIRLVEERTGQRITETDEARRKRRKENGEAMYKNSATVPDSLVQFADEIHKESRITRAEEIELGEKTQEAIRLQNLYENLEKKLDREPTDEEWCAAAGKINMEAIEQVIEEGLEAKNKLVTSNLRMVQSVVNTYIRNGLTAQYNAGDMMQDGIMALIRAAEKFEPDRGWKFSTYAMYWVRSSVKRSQIFQSRVITVPQRLYENHKRLIRLEKEMTAELGRKPTKKELGDLVGMSELQVERCFQAMEQRCVSLDQEITNSFKPMNGDAGKDTLIELVESRTDDGEHSNIQHRFLREAIIESLHRHLDPDEVELLMLRYGLTENQTGKLGRQLTIAELSRMFSLTPDKVRRTIDKSLKHLKIVGLDEWLAYDREL